MSDDTRGGAAMTAQPDAERALFLSKLRDAGVPQGSRDWRDYERGSVIARDQWGVQRVTLKRMLAWAMEWVMGGKNGKH